jgi:hypothetical protein
MASLMNPYEGQVGDINYGNTAMQNATAAINFADLMDTRNKRKIEEARAEKDFQENEQIKQLVPRFIQQDGNVDFEGLSGAVMQINPLKARKIVEEAQGLMKSTTEGGLYQQSARGFNELSMVPPEQGGMELGDVQRYWGSVNPGWQSVSKPEPRGSAILEQIELQKEIDAMPEGPMKDKMNEFFMRAKNFGLSGAGIKQSLEKETTLVPVAGAKASTTTAASGAAKADTPEFVADRQKEWQAEVKPFAEVMQNYALANSGATGAVSDVALIKALEKVREPNSAVMFGDAEIWRKSGNFFDKAVEGGIIDAVKSGTTKTLPKAYRVELRKLLDNAYAVAKQKMDQKRASYIDVAKRDYGWKDDKINRVFSIPQVQSKKQGSSFDDLWKAGGGK